MAICSDCHHCVVATSSGLVYLYNFRTTEILDVYKGHNSAVVSALLTQDEQIAVTVSKVRDHIISLYLSLSLCSVTINSSLYLSVLVLIATV